MTTQRAKYEQLQLEDRVTIASLCQPVPAKAGGARHRTRDLWHLVSRLYRKVASHTLCVLINQQLGRPLFQLDGLASI